MGASLVRQYEEGGWRFTARPNPEGTAWLLKDIRPRGAEVTGDAVVYQLDRGDRLVDCFNGRVDLVLKNEDKIVLNPDGTARYERSDGTLRSELTASGESITHMIDGPWKEFASWATVILYGR